MTKLYSESALYAFVLGQPSIAIAGTIATAIYVNGMEAKIWLYILLLVLMLFWVFIVPHAKRVYYEDSSLYIYNLFSKKSIIVHKDNIGGVNKVFFYNPKYYKIVYYDDNRDAKYVYFQRDWLLSGFNDIIDKLNEV